MELISVLKWDGAPNVFAYRYPNCRLNHKSQLIVKESQEAVLVKEGLFYGPIPPGLHTLETKNFPFLTKMVTALVSNGKTPYTAEVWFVQKSVPLDMQWGTDTPIQMEDPKYHIVLPVRAYGQYGIRVVDSCQFLARLSGQIPAFTEKTLSSYFRGAIITHVKDAVMNKLASDQRSLFEIGACFGELSKSLEVHIGEALADFGVGLSLFTVTTIATDDSDSSVIQLKKALAKKAEMKIVGYSYVQERSFDTMQTAAGNAGTAGAVMGAGMGLGMGLGVGSPMGTAISEIAKNMQPNATPASRFCMNCGSSLPSAAKFCPGCGTRVE